jgi:plastocyanin
VRRWTAIAAVAAATLSLTACGDDESPASSTPSVDAADFKFEPATVRTRTGATVEWRNRGRTVHNIKGPGFFSRGIAPGESYSHRFSADGRFDYLCTLHPDSMRGQVVVEGTSG